MLFLFIGIHICYSSTVQISASLDIIDPHKLVLLKTERLHGFFHHLGVKFIPILVKALTVILKMIKILQIPNGHLEKSAIKIKRRIPCINHASRNHWITGYPTLMQRPLLLRQYYSCNRSTVEIARLREDRLGPGNEVAGYHFAKKRAMLLRSTLRWLCSSTSNHSVQCSRSKQVAKRQIAN